MIPDPVAVTLLVTETLEHLEVAYFVGGSFASTVHGEVRATLDSDLVADLRPEHVEPLAEALGADFYLDEDMVREAIHRRSSFNLIHRTTAFKVDVFIPKRRAYDREQMRRRTFHRMPTEPKRGVYVATAEDIILAKLEWYRRGGGISERQWRDVLGVMKVQSDRLDWAYLQRWAVELGVADLLREAQAQARGER